MMLRILTVFLIIVSVLFFLTVSLHSSTRQDIKRFDDEVLTNLYQRKNHALTHFDLQTVTSIYSRNIVAEFMESGGESYEGGYRELVDIIGAYGRVGRGYNKELLSQASFIDDDGMTAIVRREALESWWFDDEFQNISTTLLETEYWALEHGIPKIVRLKKEHSHLNPFFIQRLKKKKMATEEVGSLYQLPIPKCPGCTVI